MSDIVTNHFYPKSLKLITSRESCCNFETIVVLQKCCSSYLEYLVLFSFKQCQLTLSLNCSIIGVTFVETPQRFEFVGSQFLGSVTILRRDVLMELCVWHSYMLRVVCHFRPSSSAFTKVSSYFTDRTALSGQNEKSCISDAHSCAPPPKPCPNDDNGCANNMQKSKMSYIIMWPRYELVKQCVD